MLKLSHLSNNNFDKGIVLILLTLTTLAQGQGNFSLRSFTGSVEGTSNFRDWKSAINSIACTGSLQSIGNTLESVKNVEIKILVSSIKGTEGESMDRKTYEAFRYHQHPFIIYRFSFAKVKIDTKNNVLIEPLGDLTMGGVKRQVPFIAKGKVLPNGDLSLHVVKKLNLNDFDIDPPTALMGAVRVGNEVVLNFELILDYSP